MPIKYNLTNYDILAAEIKKLGAKDHDGFSDNDRQLKTMATIIASLASAQAWQTNRCIKEGSDPNREEIRREHDEAREKKWKDVRNYDIQEIAGLGVNDSFFSRWLQFNVEPDAHDDYRKAWSALKDNFDQGCDNIDV